MKELSAQKRKRVKEENRILYPFCSYSLLSLSKYDLIAKNIYFKKQMLAAYLQEHLTEAGLDEAGRGCYAGPVFAAVVILPADFHHPLLNDSKLLNEKQRNLLRPIIEKESVAFAVASVDNHTIDKINILQASFMAMHLAINDLKQVPEFLLIDGNRFKPYAQIPHQCIIKGDGKYASIAAASILAKTYRDAYMQNIHASFPYYSWDKNKGYGTAAHRNAIEEYGLSIHHRTSFNIHPLQPELTLMKEASAGSYTISQL